MRNTTDSGVTTNTWNTTVNSTKVSTRPCGDNSIHFMVLCPSGHCQTCSTVVILLQVRAYLKPSRISKYYTLTSFTYQYISYARLSCACLLHAKPFHIQVYSTRAFLIYLYILCASLLYFLHYMSMLFIYLYCMRMLFIYIYIYIYICILYVKPFIYLNNVYAYLSHI